MCVVRHSTYLSVSFVTSLFDKGPAFLRGLEAQKIKYVIHSLDRKMKNLFVVVGHAITFEMILHNHFICVSSCGYGAS